MTEKNSQSIKSDRISKSSILRAAGNIAAGIMTEVYDHKAGIYNAELVASESVRQARLIAAEVERTEPSQGTQGQLENAEASR
jgi:hypothetical protein